MEIHTWMKDPATDSYRVYLPLQRYFERSDHEIGHSRQQLKLWNWGGVEDSHLTIFIGVFGSQSTKQGNPVCDTKQILLSLSKRPFERQKMIWYSFSQPTCRTKIRPIESSRTVIIFALSLILPWWVLKLSFRGRWMSCSLNHAKHRL